MPVNTDSAAVAGVGAVGAAGCVGPAALVALAMGFVGTVEEADEAGVDEPGDATAVARTRSIDELSVPHVASSSTFAVTNCACLSWLTWSTPTRAANAPTLVTCGDGALSRSVWAAAAGFSQMVSALPTACAGHCDCAPDDPR